MNNIFSIASPALANHPVSGRTGSVLPTKPRVDSFIAPLMDDVAYATWRAQKLSYVAAHPSPPIVQINDPQCLTPMELAEMHHSIMRHNLLLYDCRLTKGYTGSSQKNEQTLVAICRQLGLTHPLTNPSSNSHGISRIEVAKAHNCQTGGGNRIRYIPFTHERLNWHTDGYYNPDHRRVSTFALHCVRDAASGGENKLMDPDLLYILLRDHSPALAHALSHPHAFTIPADDSDTGSGRQAFRGPVFSLDPETGVLHARFTRRRHHIRWRNDAATQEALAMIDLILDSQHPAIHQVTLKPGQGLVCHNVLHCRTAFTDPDDPACGRLLLRLRFTQRITNPGCDHELS